MCEDCEGMCRPRCTDVLDCSSSQTCTDGRCVSTCVPGACRDGETCVTDANRPDGACVEGCYATEDCGPDSICTDGDRTTSQLGQCTFTEAVTSCAAPRQIGDGQYAGDTQAQIGLIYGSCGNPTPDVPEAVFEYRPTEDGLICVDTHGSDFDTVLSIRTGACEGTGCSEIGCNDDAQQRTSALQFQAVTTGSYFIIVDGYNNGGRFRLNIAPCDAPATEATPTPQTCN